MKKLLFIFATILIALSAQAQNDQYSKNRLHKGDTVTLCRVNNATRSYLTVNDNGGIVMHNEPNDNSLWILHECSYNQQSWGNQNQYALQHCKTKKYFYVNITKRNNNKYTVNFGLSDETASVLHHNNPKDINPDEQYEEGRIHYYFDNKDFYFVIKNNAWTFEQTTNQTLQVEKWTAHHETKFNTYFSPENYDFRLAKNNEDAQNQAKQIRFVFDLVDESYMQCKNNSTTKKLLLKSESETNLTALENKGIVPTFTWRSSGDETSTLNPMDYVQPTAESENRAMMQLSGTGEGGQYKISEDNLAWEVRITPVGKSPMGLKKTNYNNVQSYTNYVDYLDAKWKYGTKDYSATARIVRKSYRVEELPLFEFTSNPSTYTFAGADNDQPPANELQQVFKIHGYHQHGTAYYDVDNNLVEKHITYGPDGKPVKIPLIKDEGKLDYSIKLQSKNGDNWVDDNPTWLSYSVNGGDTTITVTATQNNGTYRQARLVGTVSVSQNKEGTEVHEHSGEFIIPINQRSSSGEATKLQHYDGASYKDNIKDNNLLNGNQQVHTAERIIYYTPNQDIQLRLAESNFFGYMRWYDFNTGHDPQWNSSDTRTTWATSPRGANGQAFKAINTDENSHGLYGINGETLNQSNENNPSPVLRGWNYTYDKENPQVNAASGYYTIACDVSAYTDYKIEKNNANRVTSITEPTLSYRQLFHLRPAEEIATKINTLSHLSDEDGESSFLEKYHYIASVGVDVHLATKHRYKSYTGSHESELCYFFFGTGNKLYRIGKDVQAKWYRVENKQEVQITNPTYAAYDYLQVDSDEEKTDTIILKVPSDDLGSFGLGRDLLLARFIIKYVNKNAAGPVASTIISDHEIDDHFIRLKTIDFNFKEANPAIVSVTNNNKTIKQLDYHLPWEQSTYGYYYPKSNEYSALGSQTPNRNDQAIPYYGEYFLVNQLDKDWARATAHGGANDFALYVDGTTEPGVVVSISTDAVICAGQTLYCSAWLCNPCPTSFDYNSPRNPIFRCNVEGRTKKLNPVGNDTWNDWEDISVFFVGQLPKGSGWQQIVFPVESDKSYDETRVSIYNFATGGSGNDFMVDDICLFASQLPLASYQAQTNCASDANTESSTAVILRIDYTEFQGRRDQYMYYHIFKEKNSYDQNDTEHPVSLKETLTDNSAYYHDNPGDVLQKSYGSVLIPQYDMVPTAGGSDGSSEPIKIYNSVQEFKDALVDEIQTRKTNANGADYEKSIHGKAYIQTTTNDGTKKWLLYVMHIIPNAREKDELINNLDENKYLFEHYDYTLRMANVPEELNAPECNMQTPLHATQSTEFDLYNGCGEKPLVEGFLPKVKGLCPNNLYTLHSMIENVMAPKTGTTLQEVRGSVMADWLVGFEFDDIYADTKQLDKNQVAEAKTEFEAKYGYSRAAIKTALLYDLRRPSTEYDKNCNRDAKSFEELDISCFLEKVNYYIIKDLYERGLLQLGKRTSTFYLGSSQTMRYWIYPIDGTADGTINGTKVALHDCSEPVWVMVSSKEASAELNISPLTLAKKQQLQGEYPTILFDIPTVRVRESELSGGTITVPVTESNNVDGKNPGDLLTINLNSGVTYYDFTTGEPMDKPASFEIGQRYTICTTFDLEADICPGGNSCKNLICFQLLVLPDRVIWAPSTGIYDGWGLDGNWKGWDDKNSNGQIDADELTPGYVPVAGSEVIIGNVPMDESIEFPTIDEYEHYPFVHDHNHYPMDVNASPFTCGKIYFAPGAHIHNQHLLRYEKAFVDMTIPTGSWNMMSAPLQKMYSGDMFVPHTGWWNNGSEQESSDPFVVNPFEKAGEYQSIRHTDAAYAFWQAFYNQAVNSYAESTDGLRVIKEKVDAQFIQSNTLAQPLQVGSGYNVYGLGLGEEQLVVRLPKPDTEYYYYSPEGNKTNQSVSVARKEGDADVSHKLAFPAKVGDTEMTITLTNQIASQYFLFGNPTMAYIDMEKFAADNNLTITPTFYTVQEDSWDAFAAVTQTHLAPMTSVMLVTTEPKNSITVTLKAEHLVNDNNHLHSEDNHEDVQPAAIAPRLAPNEDSSSSSEVMTLYAFASGARARTVLATVPIANDYYLIGEDALFVSSGVESQNIVTTPLNMYTVAEQVPMMADVRQGISEIPLGILAADKARSEYMQVAFYLTSNWSRECYFVDHKTGQKIRIMDGLVISVEMPENHEQRYYIEGPDTYQGSNGVVTSTTQPTLSTTGNKVWAYAPDRGNVVVSSTDLIKNATLYDITGRLITSSPLNSHLMTNSLTLHTAGTAGVYIVDVTLRDGSTERAQVIVP